MNQHEKDGVYDVPTLLHDSGAILGYLRPQDGGRGTHLLGETLSEGPLPQLKCRLGSGVQGDPSEGTARGGPRILDRDPTHRMNPVNIGSSYLGKQVTLYAQWECARGGPQSGVPYDTEINYLILLQRP